jgi:hypothetical protein
MKRYLLLFGFLFCFVSCATFNVSYDFDPEIDFSRIKTYDWMPIPEKAQMNELTLKHIKHALNMQLETKGLRLTSENPDMLIAVHGGKEKRVDTQEWGYAYDYDYSHTGPFPRRIFREPAGPDYMQYRRGIDTYEYEIGTLILDFVEAKKKSLIWRGTSVGVIDPSKTSEQINEVVTKMLENYPPAKKK